MDVEQRETRTQRQQVQLSWNPDAAKVITDTATLTFFFFAERQGLWQAEPAPDTQVEPV